MATNNALSFNCFKTEYFAPHLSCFSSALAADDEGEVLVC